MSVAVTATTTFKAGIPKALFDTQTPSFGNPYRSNYEVSANGERFLINMGSEADRSSPITVVVNWTTALSRR